MTKLTAAAGVKIADGCRHCGPLHSYAVMATYATPGVGEVRLRVGTVWQVRDGAQGHPPRPHHAVAWKISATGGDPITGPWSAKSDQTGQVFISRAWAMARLRKTLAQTRRPAPRGRTCAQD